MDIYYHLLPGKPVDDAAKLQIQEQLEGYFRRDSLKPKKCHLHGTQCWEVSSKKFNQCKAELRLVFSDTFQQQHIKKFHTLIQELRKFSSSWREVWPCTNKPYLNK